MHSGCLPRHPAVAYLCLVRWQRFLEIVGERAAVGYSRGCCSQLLQPPTLNGTGSSLASKGGGAVRWKAVRSLLA